MSTRVLRFDPNLPLVWRTPDTLQIGVDPVVVVIPQIPDEALPLLEGLRSGVTPSGAVMLASDAGLKDTERETLLSALLPAVRTPPRATALTLAVTGESAHRRLMTEHLTHLGHEVVEASDASRSTERIMVANYVPHPAEYRACMSRDTAHTPVIFRDQSVTVGPRVTPGSGPCLQCLWQHELLVNPHHQAVMSQLWGARAPADTAAMTLHATWAALSLMSESRQGEVVRIDAHTQEWTTRTVERSPDCLCQSLADATDE